MDERYRPYRRSSQDVVRPWQREEVAAAPRPHRKVGPRLYLYAPRGAPIRRLGRALVGAAVVAFAVWGAMSLREEERAVFGQLRERAAPLVGVARRWLGEGRQAVSALRRPDATTAAAGASEGPVAGLPTAAAPPREPADIDDAPTAPAAGESGPAVASADSGNASIDEHEAASSPGSPSETVERGATAPRPTPERQARPDPEPGPADARAPTSPPQTTPPVAPVRSPTGVIEAVPAPGALFLQTYPWGRAYIDGVYVGNTPLVGTEVGAGAHWIRIERPGFQPHVEYVVVEPAQPLRLTGIILKRGLP